MNHLNIYKLHRRLWPFPAIEQQQGNSSKIAVKGLIMNEVCKPSWSVKWPNTTLQRPWGLCLSQIPQQNGWPQSWFPIFLRLPSPSLSFTYHILFPWHVGDTSGTPCCFSLKVCSRITSAAENRIPLKLRKATLRDWTPTAVKQKRCWVLTDHSESHRWDELTRPLSESEGKWEA